MNMYIYKYIYEYSNVMYKCVGGPWVVFGLHDKEKRNINTYYTMIGWSSCV